MYKQCRSEQSAARQRQLEQGLLRAMLSQRYDDISVSDLCDAMQIPRKAFYRYFSSKDGALFALLDHTMLEFFTGSNRSTGSGSALEDLRQFFLFWHKHRDLLAALERSQLSGMMMERAAILAKQERLMPKKILSWSIDLQAVAMSFAISGLMSMVFQWHRQNYSISPEEITRVATVLLTKPLLSADPPDRHTAGG